VRVLDEPQTAGLRHRFRRFPAIPVTRTPVVARARPQLRIVAGQWVGGVGNLVFASIVARLLDPGEYGRFAAFLALYLLLHVPAAALSAAGAFAPARLAQLSRRVAIAGVAVGSVIVAASGLISALTRMPVSLVVALGLAAPGAGLLSLHRGLAYGYEHHRPVIASQLVEPTARLLLGVVLASIAGAGGAAVATVIAGYVALAVYAPGSPWASSDPPPPADEHAGTGSAPTGTVAVAVGFVLMAVLPAVDLLVANRVLEPADAGRFGVLSTLGGAAIFATATIPLVLIPAAVRGRASAATTATALTIGIGCVIAVAGGLVARPLVTLTFGSEFAGIAPFVGVYLMAMALLGLARVQVARLAATGDARRAAITVGVAVLVELVGVLVLGHSIGAVVGVTLFTSGALVIVLEAPELVRRSPRLQALLRPRPPTAPTIAMAGLVVVALTVRLATDRGLWVDEAISVRQAQMPFGEMLAQMRTTDVHPPLHHALLWITVRVFGTSELAVRLPSLLAGAALIPVLGWVGRVLYDRRTGWVAAGLAAIAPFCVWYSQEARMYALFMLLAAVAVGAQVQAIRRGRTGDWVLYGVATAAMCWTQYFALLPIAVQQIAFAVVAWRRRRDRPALRELAKGWSVATAIVVFTVLPLVPILGAQYEAYGNRTAGLVPGQAGAGSSAIGGSISIYAIGANMIWSFFGYHADEMMVQLAAFWPLLMLLALILLGRGRSGSSLLLLGLVVVPMAALFLVGSLKRDLFELRYFSGAVPALLLLAARVVTATTRRRLAAGLAAGALTAAMFVGLVDQQLNGANPRLYDFQGALERVHDRLADGDVLLYEPSYLGDVIAYYAPDVDARPVGSSVPTEGGVWVLATERVIDAEDTSARLGSELADLEQERVIVDRFERPNVRVWELR
jgi:O-antigen/teichoic acid export membrane protein